MSDNSHSKLYVNENVVRIIAAQVVVLGIVIIFTQSTFIALFLAADFALRAFTYLQSPLAIVAHKIAELFHLKRKLIFAPPKKFAATLGFTFSLFIALLLYFNLPLAAIATAGVLIGCAVLESVFKVCLGCYAYNLIVSPIINRIHRKKDYN